MAGSTQYSSTNESCQARIPLFPLRYSAHPRPKGGADYGYDLPTLEKGFPKLKYAQYGLRCIGGGFIYLFDETEGDVFIWSIREDDGLFSELRSKYRTLESNLKGYKTGHAAPHIWARCGSVVHLLLTDTLLTARTIQEIKSNKNKLREKIATTINIKSWTDSNPQDNTLSANNLEKQVEEFKGTSLEFSPWKMRPSRSARAIENGMKSVSSKAQIAVVMYDHIGLTQELTGLVQLACKAMERYSSAPDQDDDKEPIERHRKKIIADLIEKIYEYSYRENNDLYSKDEFERAMNRDITSHTTLIKRIREQDEQMKQLEQLGGRPRLHQPTPPFPNKREIRSIVLTKAARLNSRHIKEQERLAFLNTYENNLQRLHIDVLKYKNDRRAWLNTYFGNDPTELGSTFLRYDKLNSTSSSSHANAFCSCIEGMIWGTEETPQDFKDEERDIFSHWWQSSGENNPILVNLELDKGLAEVLWNNKRDTLLSTTKEFSRIGRYYATNALIRQVGVFALTRPNSWRGAVRDTVDDLLHRLAATGTVEDAARLRRLLEERYQDHIQVRQLTHAEADRLLRQAARVPSFTTEGSIARGAGNTIQVLDWERMSRFTRYANPFINTFEMGTASVAGVFSLMNLKSAIMDFNWQSGERGASLSSLGGAIMGLGSAMSGMLASTETAMPVAYARISSSIRIANWISGQAGVRSFGYGGAIFDAFTNAFKAHTQLEIGNNEAATHYGGASIYMGAGGAALTFGSSTLVAEGATLATVSMGVPLWGWLLAGAIFLTIGAYLMMRGNAAKYEPLDYWLNDGTFGKRQLLGRKNVDKFTSLDEENYSYMVACYSPKLIELDWSSVSINHEPSTYYAYTDTAVIPLEYDPKLEIEIHYPLPGKIAEPSINLDKNELKTTKIEAKNLNLTSDGERYKYTIRGVNKSDKGTFEIKFSYTPENLPSTTLMSRVRPGSGSSTQHQAGGKN